MDRTKIIEVLDVIQIKFRSTIMRTRVQTEQLFLNMKHQITGLDLAANNGEPIKIKPEK